MDRQASGQLFQKRLQGRKLLVLGATPGEVSLVERARELGIYVIVTDSHLDWSLAPAKYVADEGWDISWSDIDALETACRSARVDGAVAGYSEFRVENLIGLCERMGWPCYITPDQLAVTRDKIKFKQTCRSYGVPVVKEFGSPEEVDEYPVIVKPADRAGSIGVGIAEDEDALARAYRYAMEMSVTKRVIIEKYMQEDKIDIYYAVENGKIGVLTTNDVINARENGMERVVQSVWLYPGRHKEALLAKEDAHLRSMIEGMGIKDGCIFFSGFVDADENFAFFECGFRLEGGHQDNYVALRGPYNHLDLFISHALLGDTLDVPRKQEDPRLKCATVNYYVRGGVIASVEGAESIARMEDCTNALVNARVGWECPGDRAILAKAAMFSFASESPDRLAADVARANELFGVFNKNGSDMVYDRPLPSAVAGWWDAGRAEGGD